MSKFLLILTLFALIIALSHAIINNRDYTDTEDSDDEDEELDPLECDWNATRDIRSILISKVYPVLHSHSYSLPRDCPIREDTDLIYTLDKSQVQLQNGNWACSICLRQFSTRDAIDTHMSHHHVDSIPNDAHVCLADLSEIFLSTGVISSKLHFKCRMLVNSCFAPSPQLSRRFTGDWCSKFVHENVPDESSPMKLVLGIILMIGLCFFYVGVYFYRKETSSIDDLRQLSRRSGNWFGSRKLFGGKIKGY